MAANGSLTTKGIGPDANWSAFGKESFGLGIAEAVSMSVSLGVVGVADQIAPGMLKSCSRTVGKILLPYLDTIEGGLQRVCKLRECKPDLSKPPEERAESLAKTLIVFSSAWVLSFAAKLATRKAMNAHLGIPEVPKTGNFFHDFLWPSKHDIKILAADEGVHYGSLLLGNTLFASQTDDLISSTSKMLQNCGLSEKKSKQMSSMGVIWELPNALGWLAGVGAIAHERFKITHVQRLANESSLSKALPSLPVS